MDEEGGGGGGGGAVIAYHKASRSSFVVPHVPLRAVPLGKDWDIKCLSTLVFEGNSYLMQVYGKTVKVMLLFSNPMEIVPARIDFTARLLSNIFSEFHQKIPSQESQIGSFVKAESDSGLAVAVVSTAQLDFQELLLFFAERVSLGAAAPRFPQQKELSCPWSEMLESGAESSLDWQQDVCGRGLDRRVPDDLSMEEREELLNIRRRKKELIDDIERLKFEIAEVMTEIDNLTSVEESKTTQRNKQIAMGRKKFNMDPKKGIQFLIENDLLQNTAEDIAQFLYKGEGLNKTVIGDYLGERDEFNIKVLQAFVELHEFADLNLVQALRQFLWSFRLPGEAQKIDRMMEAFASRYCLCNPGVFQSTDTCYVLSFAIIMLNTSLHNHNVRDKPTVERFISMNRGINEGGDLPEELLRNLYESIKNEPFKIPEDDGNDLTHTFFNPDREGWLLKLG
ncbi:hypothetical protein AV530_000752 [Patagioenas fasciata monilis]|uniref:SEC7 domain-containing protein n=1 Tax=Patagioenas fasciata monilis TaxID=372326 RepID=A0A1V4KS52_PATFA|nr:hypothetical protein AV530_000752 [Patagioenas fasciata monilis]